jgi:branched-chain amino acid transport system substrate-binding protein
MTITKLGALVAGAVLVFGACSSSGSTAAPASGGTSAAPSGGQSSGGATKGTVKIGVDLPLSGAETANGGPTFNGIQLAVDEANAAGGVAGYKIEINKQDDAVNGAHDPKQGASNAQTLVADEAVVGMVGPFNSNVARAQIPVTNEAGLAQCSPANTGVDLTKEGSDKYRPKNPDKRNYFRVATPDDIQGPAGAQYAFNDLKKTKAWVVDDTEAFGVGVANSFSDEFKKLGGTIVKRDGNDFKKNTDFASLINAVKTSNPDVVYSGMTQVTGGGQLKKQMVQNGLNITLVGPDGIADLGTGGSTGAFITLAGVENSGDTYGTVAGIHDIPDPKAFADRYKAKFGIDPGAYSALAYACTQSLLQSIAATAGSASDMKALREAVRANIFSGAKFNTVLGTISFDQNGDSSQKFISFYKVDPTLSGGKGGWTYVKQQDFAAK